jgi:hypothetical protein
MKPSTEMMLFGYTMVAVFMAAILVPYLARRRDLITPTTFFLGGAIFFVGISSVDASYNVRDKTFIDNFYRDDYRNYMLYAVIFFAAFAVFFLLFRRVASALAAKVLVRWPPATTQVMWFMIIVATLFSLGVLVRVPIPGVAQLFFQISAKAMVMAIVLVFFAWFFDRQNPIWLTFMVCYLPYALMLSVIVGSGRRTFMTVLLAVPITYYWLSLRYQSPLKVLVMTAVAGAGVFVLVGAYSTLRHRDQVTGQVRDLGFSIETLSMMPERFDDIPWLSLMGQRAVEFSMLTRKVYMNGEKQSFLHSLKVIACNPIPRAFWPDKPKGLGYLVPKDAKARTRATWGVGIVGHAHYEGGVVALLIYAALAAFCLRFLDQVVVNNATNPFVLGIFTSVSAHIFGWLRGDIATFTIQIFAGILAGLVIAFTARFLFGTARPAVAARASMAPR